MNAPLSPRTKTNRRPLSIGVARYLLAMVLVGLCATGAYAGPPGNAVFLTGTSGSITSSNTGATTEAGQPPVPADGSIGARVWYRWTAPANGTLLLDARASDFNSVLSVFTGNQLANLALVAETGTSAIAEVPVASGSTYWIAVAGWWGDSGEIALTWGFAMPPANDAFAHATALAGTGGSITESNLGATAETGEPNHAGSPAQRSLWYRWTAPASGTYLFTTLGSDYPTTLSIGTGTQLNALTELVSDAQSDTPSRVLLNAVQGKSYFVVTDAPRGGSVTESISTLTWSPAEQGAAALVSRISARNATPHGAPNPPVNDLFANATPLSTIGGPFSANNIGATEESGEPAHSPGGACSVWYSFAAPTTGPATSGLFCVQVSGTEFTPILTVYTGATLQTLEAVPGQAITVDGSNTSLQFYAARGKIYHIVVDGTNGGSGNFTLTFSQVPATIAFSDAPVIVGCNAGRVSQWVTRTGDLKSSVQVQYGTSDGDTVTPGNNAEAGTDYVAKTGILRFAPNQISERIIIGIKRDPGIFDTKSFNVNLYQAEGNAVLGSGSTSAITIINQNNPQGVFTFTRAAYAHRRNADYAAITIERTGPRGCLNNPATVLCSTSDGTAIAGTDYEKESYTLVFLAGIAKQVFYVPLTPEAERNPKSFTVSLSSPALDPPAAVDDEPIIGVRDTATIYIDR